MPVKAEEIRDSLNKPMGSALAAVGVDEKLLAHQLKAELKAFTPEIIKFDGIIAPDSKLPKGFRKIAEGSGKTILEAKRIDMGMRQRARIDSHKLLGHYPAEEHNHTGGIEVTLRDCVKEAKEGANG
jgi:hypothetical protein